MPTTPTMSSTRRPKSPQNSSSHRRSSVFFIRAAFWPPGSSRGVSPPRVGGGFLCDREPHREGKYTHMVRPLVVAHAPEALHYHLFIHLRVFLQFNHIAKLPDILQVFTPQPGAHSGLKMHKEWI